MMHALPSEMSKVGGLKVLRDRSVLVLFLGFVDEKKYLWTNATLNFNHSEGKICIYLIEVCHPTLRLISELVVVLPW